MRTRDLIRQICDAQDVKILKGAVSHDHIHLHVAKPPSLSESEMVRRLKGRSGRKLLMEYPELKRRYWGGHLWAIGYGAWSTGVVTQEMINKYLEHIRHFPLVLAFRRLRHSAPIAHFSEGVTRSGTVQFSYLYGTKMR